LEHPQNSHVNYNSSDISKCPHAAAARAAAAAAEKLASVAEREGTRTSALAAAAAASGSKKVGFSYDTFYESELEKKHKDK
jgi:5-aminolevulinate synthase